MYGVSFNAVELERLRVEVGEWSHKNFSGTLPKERPRIYGMLRCVAGMSEELGELIGSWRSLAPIPFNLSDKLDAIGDICVYALDFCFTADISMGDVLYFDNEMCEWERSHISVPPEDQRIVPILQEGLAYFIGKLSHHTLKQAQKIRNTEDHDFWIKHSMCHIWRLCFRLCREINGVDLSNLVRSVTNEVLKRDWSQSPDSAHEEARR